MSHRVVALVLLTAPTAAFAIEANAPLECGSDPTYFPRGDRWVVTTDTTVAAPWDPRPVIYNLHTAGSDDVPEDAEREAVVRAADAWSYTECSAGVFPSVWLDRGPDYANRDAGDDETTIRNVVVWLETGWPAQWGSTTIAMTFNEHATETGFILTSDVFFNGQNFQFRATGDDEVVRGCSPTGSGGNSCFDVEAVAVHELGHLFGFDHVQCTDAVMFPNGSPTGQPVSLSEHEATGLCAVYKPRSQTATAPTLGELCDADSDCDGDLICIIQPGGTLGWCTDACDTTADCPTAYVCRQTSSGRKFCGPGVNGSGDVGTEPPAQPHPADLCAPCSSPDDCSNGICVGDGETDQQLCTITCSGDGDVTGDGATCPSGMGCVATAQGVGVCWPNGSGTCGDPETRGDLNEQCYSEAEGEVAACGPDLVCFVFKPRPEGQVGNCVRYCNDSDTPCPERNQECCFGIDDGGACLPWASDRPHGGCFDIRTEGQSCVTPEESICEDGTGCYYFNTPLESQCYRGCAASSCDASQTCVQWGEGDGALFLCCDSDDFADDPTRCTPLPPSVLNVGVECRLDDDCDSGLCLKYDGGAACSRECDPYTGYGCPGDIDVNGDGASDGGFTCLLLDSGEGRCWPIHGPAEAPRGFYPPQEGGETGLCGCAGGGDDAVLVIVGLIALARRRRTCRAASE